MVKVKINDKVFEADKGSTLLEIMQKNGIKVPTLCYHKEVSPYGACRLCLIEVVKGAKPGVFASCTYKVLDGLEVKTDTERVKNARNIMFELLLARSPDSEVIKKLAKEYGITKTRIKWPKTDKCVLCGLCVRACAEISQRFAISFTGRGQRRRVQTPFDKISDVCIGCQACVYICPTDAIKIEED